MLTEEFTDWHREILSARVFASHTSVMENLGKRRYPHNKMDRQRKVPLLLPLSNKP